MKTATVKIKLTHEAAALPEYKTPGSAGCDVYAVEEAEIWPGQRRSVRTGICMQIPEGFECQVRPRSGLARDHGIVVFNSPSTIDSDYRGELSILLKNNGMRPYTVKAGDRIAQLVFAPVVIATFTVTDELDETARGTGGWGSTGKR